MHVSVIIQTARASSPQPGAANLSELEKLNPTASPLDSKDTLHSTLDSLLGPREKHMLSVDEIVKTMLPHNRVRSVSDCRDIT